MLAKQVIDKVAVVLQDTDHERWSESSLLGWLSEAQIAVARTPGAYSKVVTLSLVSGTRQQLPSDAWVLISIRNNVDLDGTPLKAVRITTRSLLDAVMPHWHEMPALPLVENYVYDDRVPKEFQVYPPNDGTGMVDVIYSGIPAALTTVNDTLVLDDTFEPALKAYVLSCAFAVDSDFSAGSQLSTGWYTAYNDELNKALQARGMQSPNAAFSNAPVKSNGSTE